jgi:hypothetical protein
MSLKPGEKAEDVDEFPTCPVFLLLSVQRFSFSKLSKSISSGAQYVVILQSKNG